MKIDNLQMKKIQQIYQQQKNQETKKNTARKDKMNISSKAREIRQLQKKLAEMPDVRGDKIEKIKTAVKNNDYFVDSKLVARKIMEAIEQE